MDFCQDSQFDAGGGGEWIDLGGSFLILFRTLGTVTINEPPLLKKTLGMMLDMIHCFPPKPWAN